MCALSLSHYLTLCNPMACSLPGSSVHRYSPGKCTGVGCRALLQGIFPTQGLNPGVRHCRQILYRLSHQGSPKIIIFHFKSYTSFFFNVSEATRFMCIERPILLCAATWMDLEDILLRQKSQRGKDKHCVIPHKCGI